MSTHILLVQEPYAEGILYAFDKMGEGLMMHDHEDDTAHNIEVMDGSVLVYGKAPSRVLYKGEKYDLDWSIPHEVVALDDKTVIFNRFINGVPKEYRDLPIEKRSGSMNDTLHNLIPYHTVLGG